MQSVANLVNRAFICPSPLPCFRRGIRLFSSSGILKERPITIRENTITRLRIDKQDVVEPTKEVPSGSLVPILNKQGQKLGDGFYHKSAPSRIRVVNYGPSEFTEDDLLKSVQRAVDYRKKFLRLDDVSNAYRVVNSDGDLLSGLTVDRFNDVLSVSVHSLGIARRIPEILAVIHTMLKTKHQIINVPEKYAVLEGIDPKSFESHPIEKRKIREHDVIYEINFLDSHKGGFFCDQRDNRLKLANIIKNRNYEVLDLCSYTGGFALNARINGRARKVVAVDMDEGVEKQALINVALNEHTNIEVVCNNMFPFSREMKSRKRVWDVVVLDPPKLLSDIKMISSGLRRYEDMNKVAMELVKDGGLFVTCSCSGLVNQTKWEEAVFLAAKSVGKTLQIIDRTGASPDHPEMSDCPESRYLKVMWARVYSMK